MSALKASYIDVGEEGVAVNCEKKTQFFLNTLYLFIYSLTTNILTFTTKDLWAWFPEILVYNLLAEKWRVAEEPGGGEGVHGGQGNSQGQRQVRQGQVEDKDVPKKSFIFLVIHCKLSSNYILHLGPLFSLQM